MPLNRPIITESDSVAVAIPEENLLAYRHMYLIEVALRELIIESMENAFGAKWWKTRLKGEEQRRPFSESIEYERSHQWTSTVSHHPVYYLLLTDLKDVILRRDNWREVFSCTLKDESVFRGTLTEIEPVRNKVAHNRIATPTDVAITLSALTKLTNLIGRDRFVRLCERNTHASDLPSQINKLHGEAQNACQHALRLQPLEELRQWHLVNASWWFVSEYLGVDVSLIENLFGNLAIYADLPRRRGNIFEIETWVREQRLDEQLGRANSVFALLMSQSGRTT